MLNLVELCADESELSLAPCKWGQIVQGHACYCHNDEWKEGPRKCPVWRNFGADDPDKWHQRSDAFNHDDFGLIGGCDQFAPTTSENRP